MSDLHIEQLMQPDEAQNTGIHKLNQNERQALLHWAMRMYSLGQHKVDDIQSIKYNGRLIILGDGTRWEVAEYDSGTVELWDAFEKVVIIDNEMYRLDENEKVSVTEELEY